MLEEAGDLRQAPVVAGKLRAPKAKTWDRRPKKEDPKTNVYVICRLGGPTVSRQITCLLFFFLQLVLQITNGFVYAAPVIESACAPSTICKKSGQRASNSDSGQRKMY